MVVYDNEVETKENKVNAKNIIELQHTFSNLIITITKLSNVIGYNCPDFSLNWTV